MMLSGRSFSVARRFGSSAAVDRPRTAKAANLLVLRVARPDAATDVNPGDVLISSTDSSASSPGMVQQPASGDGSMDTTTRSRGHSMDSRRGSRRQYGSSAAPAKVDSFRADPAGEPVGMAVKMVALMNDKGVSPRLKVTGRASIMFAFRSVANMTSVHRRTSKDLQDTAQVKVACFRPMVGKGCLNAVLNEGFRESQAFMLVEAITNKELAAAIEGASESRVSKNTPYSTLAYIVAQNLLESGKMTLRMVGDLPAETTMKALLQARTKLLAAGMDLLAIPELKLEQEESTGFVMEVLTVHIIKAERLPPRVPPATSEPQAAAQATSDDAAASQGARRSAAGSQRQPRTTLFTGGSRPMRGSNSSSTRGTASTAEQSSHASSRGDAGAAQDSNNGYQDGKPRITITVEEWQNMNKQLELMAKQNNELAQIIATKLS